MDSEEITKARTFGTIVYPESALENWQKILEEQHIASMISPLHDSDVNDETGEIKKAHYHVIIQYSGMKTTEQAGEIFSKIGGVGCEVVQSIRGYARYLCHLDNPDKAQYNPMDVICLSGADYAKYISCSTDKYQVIGEIMEFCIDNDIVSFATLLEYAKNENYIWFKALCDSSCTVREYLKSRHWTERNCKL